MIDYSFGYETNDGHHGLGTSEAAPPVAFTVRRHDAENPLACEEVVYRPERTCENMLDDHSCDFECSACGFSVSTFPDEGTDWQTPFWSYCPNCGAKVTKTPEGTCRMNHVLLYDEEGVEGIECDECGWEDIHGWDEPMPERCPGCNRKVVE